MALVENDAAMILEEKKDLTPAALKEIIEQLLADPARFKAIGQHARDMAVVDAQRRICDIIVSLAEK